jgi:hypothetical protein
MWEAMMEVVDEEITEAAVMAGDDEVVATDDAALAIVLEVL